MMFMGVEMDIQKEREAFEAWFLNKYQYSAEYFQITKFDADRGFYTAIDHYNPDSVNSAWVLRSSFDSWQAAKAKAVPKWISVNDQMPPIDETVLVCWDHAQDIEPEKEYVTTDENLDEYWPNCQDEPPTHWMPLPKVIEAQEQSHD